MRGRRGPRPRQGDVLTRRLLVTGGWGFLGKHVRALLAREELTVIAPRRDELDVTREFPDLGAFDVLIHLAGRTFVPDSWQRPGLFWQVNAGGTINALDACRRHGAAMVLVSAYGYGNPDSLPIPEETVLRPTNPYAFSKVAAEEACRYYAKDLGVPAVILRPFNIYGPGQDERFLVPSVLRQALAPDVAAVELADCAPRRDYVHIDDVARAVVTAALREEKAGVFNIGSGRSHSVGEVARLILDAAGVSKPIVDRKQTRPNEIMDTVADISAAARELDWRPRTSLEAGLAALVADARPQAV
ncbi:GDP-mannose 4,6-dehydratase [Starkeya koreensis]|uniref:GDP-mannose 4,6-dehydratase n=1 Tax=Ancylobacter koreensis TaxID=266121 RepID=A0ABT0DKG8_9HYPH|nr:NAD-dependent epimerase/dehydratase family protein [Ancylobacter koreensis]MCK0207788.1 GDP-mannose 4,6-dehydratase [Ancylobacter koreensis]